MLQWLLSAGLGLFEYMELAEELGADAVWVFNNGVAHDESIPTADIQPLIRDTLGSLEFVRGSPESKWGSVRAQLGRQQPWPLNYVAIGNEVRWSMTAVHLRVRKGLLLTHIYVRCARDTGMPKFGSRAFTSYSQLMGPCVTRWLLQRRCCPIA